MHGAVVEIYHRQTKRPLFLRNPACFLKEKCLANASLTYDQQYRLAVAGDCPRDETPLPFSTDER
jgi:hypothetical protein